MAIRNKVQWVSPTTKSQYANCKKETVAFKKVKSFRPGRSIDDVRSKSVKEVLSKDFDRHLPGLRYLADR